MREEITSYSGLIDSKVCTFLTLYLLYYVAVVDHN